MARMTTLPKANETLPGRESPMPVPERHFISGNRMTPPFPADLEFAMFGMGCFWGAERLFWEQPGVHSTAAGYARGVTLNPSYQEACTGLTGHTEVVRVVFDPKRVSYAQLLRKFWESHDPTQGMRQRGDIGTQYRSAIYAMDERQLRQARDSQAAYQAALDTAGHGRRITTEIGLAPPFNCAEEYHQQYPAKNSDGYCGIGGVGVGRPAGLGVTVSAAD